MYENEEWRVCVQAPDYMVSNINGRLQNKRGKIMRASTINKYDRLSLMVDGAEISFDVHVLVCTAFNGPKPSTTHHAAHNDNNTKNNSASNLAWKTPTENEKDKSDRYEPRSPGWHEEVLRAHFLFDVPKRVLARQWDARQSRIQYICGQGLHHGLGQSV